MVRVVLVCALLCAAAPAAAEEPTLEGTGRVSGLAGWRYTPNNYFAASAADAGFPTLSASRGGPMIAGSFGYAMTELFEIDVDLFGGSDALSLSGLGPITTYTYGGLLGVRVQKLFRPSFWPRGVVPFAGLYTGPTVVDAVGPQVPFTESLVTGYAMSAGALVHFTDRLALTFEVKVLLARGQVPNIGGINGGGAWLAVGMAWMFPRDTVGDRPLGP